MAFDENEIVKLISMKQEGPYWDFKREWYSKDPQKKADLVHDILAMANNLENRDAYIIIGIDEENDYRPYGLGTDPNRRETQDLVCLLRDLKFAGENRPLVTVEHCQINACILDVIVVHRTDRTPYYLTREYHPKAEKPVRPFHIYTRVQDTNTPKNACADIGHVEYLWKKRLGLVQTPMERLNIFLQKPEEWIPSPGKKDIKYYRWSPEYTIRYELFSDPKQNPYEFYMLNQRDTTPRWGAIYMWYHSTLMYRTSSIELDGGRYFSPVPLWGEIHLTNAIDVDIEYCYWIEGTLEYSLHKYCMDDDDEAKIAKDKFMENILVFKSEDEKEIFEEFVKANWSDELKNQVTYICSTKMLPKGYNKQVFEDRLKNARRLNILLKDFRFRTYPINRCLNERI